MEGPTSLVLTRTHHWIYPPTDERPESGLMIVPEPADRPTSPDSGDCHEERERSRCRHAQTSFANT